MRAGCAFVVVSALAAFATAQATDQSWRDALMNLPEHPTANLQDLTRFERHLSMSMPYFATLTPGDYEANRELIRRITVYMAGLDMLSRNPQISRDPQMRAAIGRTRGLINQMRFGYLMGSSTAFGGSASGQPPQQQHQSSQATSGHREPPFSLMAPKLGKVAPADAKLANELCSRYETDAIRSAAAWQNVETLRLSLEGQGASLNVQTATSVSRLQLYFESAAAALREGDWEEARTNLTRAEAETEKIFKTVGR
jgi:hypothetical protein